MTVTAHPKDHDAMTLKANIDALVAKAAVTSSTLTLSAMNAKLDQLQRELVIHYIEIGRLNAASILSTMS